MATLVFSEAAQADLIDIQLYGIVTFGLKAADHYVDGLREAIGRLRDFPRLAPARPDLNPSVRILPYRSHIVVYLSDERIVRVLRIRHGREDWYDDPTGDRTP